MRTPDPFDPDTLRAPSVDLVSLCNRPSKRPPRHRNGEAFLKGPIPWLWLERACRLPGKALHVAMLLWKEAGCTNNRTVALCLARPAALGMHPDTASRALRALAAAALVSIRHRPGKALEVTLLDAHADKSSG
jgi:hypothetical protein